MDQQTTREEVRYAHGYSEEHRTFLATRTAAREAGFFLPYLQPDMRLLDCGCGMGALTTSLAQFLDQGEVVGIDRDPSQVEAARQWAAEKNVRNVSFEIGDLFHLPFPDASFDAVFAFTVLEHVSDPMSAIREMRRVLRPGGVVGIQDPDYGSWTLTPSNTLLEDLRRFMIRFSEENGSPYYARHLRRYLLEAGFARSEGFAFCVGGGNSQLLPFNHEMIVKPTIENLRPWIIQRLLADDCHIDEVLAEAKAWSERPDSFFALMQCAAVGWVD